MRNNHAVRRCMAEPAQCRRISHPHIKQFDSKFLRGTAGEEEKKKAPWLRKVGLHQMHPSCASRVHEDAIRRPDVGQTASRCFFLPLAEEARQLHLMAAGVTTSVGQDNSHLNN